MKKLIYNLHIEINLFLHDYSIKSNTHLQTPKSTKYVYKEDLFSYYEEFYNESKKKEKSMINNFLTGDLYLLIEIGCEKCDFKKFTFQKFSELNVDLNPNFSE